MLRNAAVGFVVLWLLFWGVERLRPVRARQPKLRAGWGTDTLHFFLTGILSTIGLVMLALPIVIPLRLLTPASLHSAVASQPGWLQLLEALAVVEIVGYWAHRWSHTVPALWKLHRVHHSSAQLDWLAATHLHPLDGAFGRLLAVVPLGMLGFSRATFGISIVILQLHAIFQHANVETDFGPLRHLVSSPKYHHWHHTNDVDGRNTNYAGLFPWLDRIFGTQHLPDRWPSTYGIDEPIPDGYLGQLGSPFRRPEPAPASLRSDHASAS